jgi:hypothetical protein
MLLISIIIGCIIGIIFKEDSLVLKPLGTVFINMLYTIVVPLVFFTISSSIANINNFKKLGKIFKVMFIVFIITSSIAAIFELNDKRILWLSDSVPSVIVSSLSQLGYCESNKMYCDCVLLSHHGSVGNNSIELFKLIQADKYIISTDGINKYSLPNKETVARIVFSSISFPISIYFNYDDGRLSRMFKSDEPEKLKMMVDIHYLGDRQVIEV